MRLFFALWPPREAAQALHGWALRAQRGAGGRVTREDTIHLTLAFLGEVAADRAALAAEAARAVRFERHAMLLEEARLWPRNRIVWAGPHAAPAATAALAEKLRLQLAARGFAPEKRPFAVHVTLIRRANARGELPPLAPVRWPVEEFVLVRSRLSARGPDYEVLERFAAS
jgi:2'-5' RNA ligase